MARIDHSKLRKEIFAKIPKITDRELFTGPSFKGFLEVVVETITKTYKKPIKIIIEWKTEKDDIAYTTGNKLYINANNALTVGASRVKRFRLLKGSFLHECGHILFTDFVLLKICKKKLTDEHILYPEPTAMKEYEGVKDFLSTHNPKLIEKLLNLTNNSIEDGYVDKRIAEKVPGYEGDLKYRLETMYASFPTYQEMLDKKTDKVSILIKLILCYAKLHSIKAPSEEFKKDETLKLLLCCIPYIDKAVITKNSYKRRLLINEVFCLVFPTILKCIEEAEKEKEKKEAAEEDGSEGSESSEEDGSEGSESSEDDGSEGSESSEDDGSEGSESSEDDGSEGSESSEDDGSEGSESSEDDGSEGSESSEDDGSEGRIPLNDDEIENLFSKLLNDSGMNSEDLESLELKGETRPVDSLEYSPEEETKDETEEELIERITKDETEEETKDEDDKSLSSILEKEALEKVIEDIEKEIKKDIEKLDKEIDYDKTYHNCRDFELSRINPTYNNKEAYNVFASKLISISRRIQKQLIKEIKDRQLGDKNNGLYTGKRIDTHSLHRRDKKIFYKKNQPQDIPDMEIILLIDESGSMSGLRIDAAKKTAIIVYDFCTALGIPISIYGHTEHYNKNKEVVLNSYAEFDSVDGSDKYRLMNIQARENNRDGYALRFCCEKLHKRTATSKILFVISDGAPAASNYGYTQGKKDVHNVVSEYRKKGILIITAGIGDDRNSVKDVYTEGLSEKRSAVYLDITDLNTLPKTFVNIIKKHLE